MMKKLNFYENITFGRHSALFDPFELDDLGSFINEISLKVPKNIPKFLNQVKVSKLVTCDEKRAKKTSAQKSQFEEKRERETSQRGSGGHQKKFSILWVYLFGWTPGRSWDITENAVSSLTRETWMWPRGPSTRLMTSSGHSTLPVT